MDSVERFITVVGALEDVIFQKRMRLLQRDKNRRARDRQVLLELVSSSHCRNCSPSQVYSRCNKLHTSMPKLRQKTKAWQIDVLSSCIASWENSSFFDGHSTLISSF